MKKSKDAARFPATLDRFEGDLGVVYLGEGEKVKVDIPRRFLPPGVREGARLTVTIEHDEGGTEDTRQRVLKLQQELLKKNQP